MSLFATLFYQEIHCGFCIFLRVQVHFTTYQLEKENKSLKNEIKDIYKGFKAYFKDSKQVTTEQVKTLVGGVVDKVKEFVKGGEFEKFIEMKLEHEIEMN